MKTYEQLVAEQEAHRPRAMARIQALIERNPLWRNTAQIIAAYRTAEPEAHSAVASSTLAELESTEAKKGS